MGTIAPIASQAITALSVANKVISTIKPVANVLGKGFDFFDDNDSASDLALSQLQQQQKLQQQQEAQNSALEKQGILVKAQEAENQRRSALKRAVARQRARFGSSGVNSNGGSSEAVLLGLFEESDQDKMARENLDNLRLNAIDQESTQRKRVNTLQREQLNQKNKLKETVSPLESIKGFLDIF